MRPIKLKTFFKRCIYHDKEIRVYQNFIYRWFTFGTKPIQSMVNRRHPERHILSYLTPMLIVAKSSPGPTCVLGLGGASMIHSLRQVDQNNTIDICELSSNVVNVSKHFFYLDKCQNINLTQKDAAIYIKNNIRKYKHILIDLFNEQSFPDNCNTPEFFKDCFMSLAKKGVLAINIANPCQYRSILHLLKEIFENNIISIPIKHSANYVIIAFKDRSFEDILGFFYQNFKIKVQEWDSEFGYVLMI